MFMANTTETIVDSGQRAPPVNSMRSFHATVMTQKMRLPMLSLEQRGRIIPHSILL